MNNHNSTLYFPINKYVYIFFIALLFLSLRETVWAAQYNTWINKPPSVISQDDIVWIRGVIRSDRQNIQNDYIDVHIYKKNPNGTWGTGDGTANTNLCGWPAYAGFDAVYCYQKNDSISMLKCDTDVTFNKTDELGAKKWCDPSKFTSSLCESKGLSTNCYTDSGGKSAVCQTSYWYTKEQFKECGDYKVVLHWADTNMSSNRYCGDYDYFESFDITVKSKTVSCPPPNPTYIQYCIEKTKNGSPSNDPANFSCIPLSTDPNNPTIVPQPSAGETAYLKTNYVPQNYSCGSETNEETMYTDFKINTYSYSSTKNYSTSIYDKTVLQPGTTYSATVKRRTIDPCTKEDILSNTYRGYIKLDSTPQIISVTPNNGISGTFTDQDNGYGCSDNNPIKYTVRYRDPDGVQDISSVGLWIGASQPNIDSQNKSVHQIAKIGSEVKIFAQGIIPSTGKCSNYLPTMEVRIKNNGIWETVKQITGITADMKSYSVFLPYKVSADQIQIRFPNNCDDPATNTTTDLRIERIVLDGISYKTNTIQTVIGNYWNGSTCVAGETANPATDVLRCDNSYFRYSGSALSGPQSSWIAGGLRFDKDFPALCGGSKIACADNYIWNVPSTTNGFIVPSSDITCTSISGTSDRYNDNCTVNASSSNIKLTKISKIDSKTLDVEWTVSYLDKSGQLPYAYGNKLNIYGLVTDGYNTTNPWYNWKDIGNWTLDLKPPTVKVLSITANTNKAGHVDLDWSASDGETGINRVFMKAVRSDAKKTTKIGLGDSLNYMPLTSSDGIWNDKGAGTVLIRRNLSSPKNYNNTEDVNLGFNDGGSISFWPAAVDSACNFSGNASSIGEFKLWTPWINTKGGLLYSFAGHDFTIPDFDDHTLVSQQRINNSLVWGSPYSVYQDELDITSESFESDSVLDETPFNINYKKNLPFVIDRYKNSIITEDWYSLFEKSAEKKVDANPTMYKEKSLIISSLSGKLSTIFQDENKRVIAKRDGNLTIQSNFMCDRSALFLINGNLTINPDTFNGNNILDGCIFVVNGNIVITEGQHKTLSSDSYISYDIINGFFISLGTIQINEETTDPITSDGLRVIGSLIALKGDSKSIILNRSLGFTGNGKFPALSISYDPRYIEIAKYFITDKSVVKITDIGFKAY